MNISKPKGSYDKNHELFMFSINEIDVVSTLPEYQKQIRQIKMLSAWVNNYLMKSHPDLGRTGPVCPFVPKSVALNHFYISFFDRSISDPQIIAKTLIDYRNWFHELSLELKDDLEYLCLVILLPALPYFWGARLSEMIVANLKSQFIEKRLMIGEFHHEPPNNPGLKNKDFRPLTAPFPMVAIRNMVSTDIAFLEEHEEFSKIHCQFFDDKNKGDSSHSKDKIFKHDIEHLLFCGYQSLADRTQQLEHQLESNLCKATESRSLFSYYFVSTEKANMDDQLGYLKRLDHFDFMAKAGKVSPVGLALNFLPTPKYKSKIAAEMTSIMKQLTTSIGYIAYQINDEPLCSMVCIPFHQLSALNLKPVFPIILEAINQSEIPISPNAYCLLYLAINDRSCEPKIMLHLFEKILCSLYEADIKELVFMSTEPDELLWGRTLDAKKIVEKLPIKRGRFETSCSVRVFNVVDTSLLLCR